MIPENSYAMRVYLATNSELKDTLKMLHLIPADRGSNHEKLLIRYTMLVIWERLLRDCWAE